MHCFFGEDCGMEEGFRPWFLEEAERGKMTVFCERIYIYIYIYMVFVRSSSVMKTMRMMKKRYRRCE